MLPRSQEDENLALVVEGDGDVVSAVGVEVGDDGVVEVVSSLARIDEDRVSEGAIAFSETDDKLRLLALGVYDVGAAVAGDVAYSEVSPRGRADVAVRRFAEGSVARADEDGEIHILLIGG